MLDTLLAGAAPGQRWPAARESAALIRGGIRARAGVNSGQPAAASFRLAAMLACAVYLGLIFGSTAAGLIERDRFGLGLTLGWDGWAVLCACVFGTITVTWFARQAVAVVAQLAMAATGLAMMLAGTGSGLRLFLVMLVLALLTSLRTERLPRWWFGWLCLLPAWSVASSSGLVHRAGPALFAAFLLVPVVCVLTDARPTFALAILLAFLALTGLARPHPLVGPSPFTLVLLGCSVVAALPMLLRLRRRAT
jgi:hypothetical protein